MEEGQKPRIDFPALVIGSPKRVRKRPVGWDAFFPYYAGYPEAFASTLIGSAGLAADSRVYDPWNGSGTTTFAAMSHSLESVGTDLNPAMIVIARARSLPPSEADSLVPLAKEIVKQAKSRQVAFDTKDPLCHWFDESSARWVRSLESSLRNLLVGNLANFKKGGRFDRLSAVASTFYVALFATCRRAAAVFQSSNPTWFKIARNNSQRLAVDENKFGEQFVATIVAMANGLVELACETLDRGPMHLHLGDSAQPHVADGSIDFVLTSPPYCTRIDYTSATRVELALLKPLFDTNVGDLARQMIGSTRVPTVDISIAESWGPTCARLIHQISTHASKASSGYYKKTHLDYFAKLDRSLASIAVSLRKGGAAVMVVQDSYYKDIHNPLPDILTEMAAQNSLDFRRRENFNLASTLAGSHPHSKKYNKPKGAVESVICFERV